MNESFESDWDNVDLGQVDNQKLGKRVFKIAGAILRMLRSPAVVKEADVIVARNFDLLVVAWVSMVLLSRGRVPLVYECLDIHSLFTRQDQVGHFMRWCERRLLSRIRLLIVSSPGFLRSYFEPIQNYTGPVALIENKLWFEGDPVPRPTSPPKRVAHAPLRLGWVGSIRCAASLSILMETADQLGPDITLRIHGNIHRHALPGFDDEIAKRDNVEYLGPYQYPDGLADVYADCDLVWAQDLWQRGGNSDWLLPNRIYEASWFGCPSIAVADTETGRRVAEAKLGLTIATPSASDLVECLTGLTAKDIENLSRTILKADETEFRLRPEDIERALHQALPS
ncbi:MAG: glycosyltransferase [Marinosulfonomonas sp.]